MSGFYPFNPNLGQVMQTMVPSKQIDASYLGRLSFTPAEAVAASATGVHAAITCSADSVVNVTTAITNPVTPRSITATAGGTAADIKAVAVTITGTNFLDEVITEALPAFVADTAGTKEGSKAFKTVTGISIPAMDGAAATVSIGWGDKLGLPFTLPHNTLIATFLNNVKESTNATVGTSATAIESNTVDLHSALNGTKVDAYFMV